MPVEEFDPLHLVESIAGQFAQPALERHLHIIGYAEPGLPATVHADGGLIRKALYLMTDAIMHDLRTGALVVEVYRDLTSPEMRFGVADSRNDLSKDDLELAKRNLLDERRNEQTLRDMLNELNTELFYDDQVLSRTTRFFFKMPHAKSEWNPATFDTDSCLQDKRMYLVANDPPPNRIIQQYCRFHGLDMQGAPTASEALLSIGHAASAGNPYKVIAVAPPIEDMNANHLAAVIRESDLHDVKLLYIAPWRDEEDIKRALESGFDLALSKPFTKRQLFEQLAKLAADGPCAVRTKPLVLIVEDNPVNQKLAMFQVRSLGFDVMIVQNGQQAVEAAGSVDFVAIFMDIQMPIMDGIQATRAIRMGEDGSGKHVPIIGLTANEHMRQEALSAGMDEFVTKPASKERLSQALTRLNVRVVA